VTHAEPVAAVLWDADGVLQDVPSGWEASMRPAVGHLLDDVDAFLTAAFEAERPALTGDARWMEVLPRLLEQWGVPEAYGQAVDVWLTIEPVPEVRALVEKVRASGVRCFLATNQDEHRGGYMQAHLGYADLMDGALYSYEMRVAKPDPAYFRLALDRLRLQPGQVLLVDDNVGNVEAARGVGLIAEKWHVLDGVDVLVDILRRHGLGV
jgi:putative hydrolase of the HAD superfamily